MSTYTIGEVADRSGFSASALRYYEGIGLLEPAGRTDGGYRLYDDAAVERLAFIARAKQLGCSLEEVTDLVGIWDGQRCGPVQRRFHELVTDKLRRARHQVVELTRFASQLEAAAVQLGGEPVDGPCSDNCACAIAAPASSVTSVGAPADPPIDCTLDAGALAEQLTEWKSVLERARERSTRADGTLRIEFGDDIDLTELTRLVAAEQACCAFFSFAITVDQRGAALEVRAPDDAASIVAELFGLPA